MSLGTYDELQAATVDWMKRAGQLGNAPDWVSLAEAKLNRELGPVETDASRTGTLDSRNISISALSIVEPLSLWVMAPDSLKEREVQRQAPANMAYSDYSGAPGQWVMDSETNIKLDRPCDQEYAFRFRFKQRFALSDAAPTNWLLTNHPDIYLAACLMWGAGYNESWSNGQIWKSILDEGIPAVKNVIAQQKRGTLRVDPGLMPVGRRTYNDLVANG